MSAPILSSVTVLTSTSVRASVAGDPGATHCLYFGVPGEPWIAGAERVGDGDIDQTGLTAGARYLFMDIADSDPTPSNVLSRTLTAPTEPVIERIAQALVMKLSRLVDDGLATAVVRPLRGGKLPPRKDGQIILVQEDPRRDPRPPAGFSQWIQPFGADLIVIPADESVTPVDQPVNEFRAVVEKQLRTDPQFAATDLKGAVVDTVIQDPLSFDPAERVDGVRVQFEIVFRHRRDDPYSFT